LSLRIEITNSVYGQIYDFCLQVVSLE